MGKKPVIPGRSDYRGNLVECVNAIMKGIEAGKYHYDVYKELGGDIGYLIYIGYLDYTFPAEHAELDQVQNDMDREIESYLAEKGEKDPKACAWFYGDVLLIDW